MWSKDAVILAESKNFFKAHQYIAAEINNFRSAGDGDIKRKGSGCFQNIFAETNGVVLNVRRDNKRLAFAEPVYTAVHII